MVELKIDFPDLPRIVKSTSPEIHEAVWTKTCNDLFSRALPKVITQIKKKFNLKVTKDNFYSYKFTSQTGISRKRGNTVKFFVATKNRPKILIVAKGESIDDYLFDASFTQADVSKAKSKKRKERIKKRINSKRRMPRVKILKRYAPKDLPKTFYATMSSGHTGIFRKLGKRIIEMRTITVASMFKQVDWEKIFNDHFKQNVDKRYLHYLKREYKKNIWI